MQNGMNIALITDAGTPGISDPGEELAAMCYEAGIEVTSLPGPAACITALTLSGLPTRRFAFDFKMIQQFNTVSGIFCRDQIHFLQCAEYSKCNIFQISDWGCTKI